MKLARFDGGRIGVVRGESIVDVTGVLGAARDEWPPVGMNRLIANFAQLREKLERAAGQSVPLAAVKLQTPVPWPNKIMAFPVNYQAHGAEMGSAYRANTQGFFLKPPSALIGPSEPIVLPPVADRGVQHECELAIVIGKEGGNIAREDALDHVFGLTLGNEGSVRDWLRHGTLNVTQGKNFDKSGSIGPWVVTSDELAPGSNMRLMTRVNGELRQDDTTDRLTWDFAELIRYISQFATLKPGDLIFTGTPVGAGGHQNPKKWLVPGDVVEVEVAEIGILRNRVEDDK